MDMALYALLMSSLQGQTECKKWNGYRIELVDKIPEVQNPNTIYLVMVAKEEVYNIDHEGDTIVSHDGDSIIF